MRRYVLLLSCAGVVLSLFIGRLMPVVQAATPVSNLQTRNFVQYVNPFIGTADSNSPDPVPGGSGGSDFPGAVAPFGMVQFSPDTPNGEPSGYKYTDAQITGFSLTHFSGAGCANNGDIPISPTVGNGNVGHLNPIVFDDQGEKIETGTAGYYAVKLGNGVKAELTATQRTGFARFSFPKTSSANVIMEVGRGANGATSNPQAQSVGSNTIEGQETDGKFCGSGATYTLHFVATFDHNFSFSNNGSTSIATFNTTTNPVIQMKIGISYVSIANARQNLKQEDPNWNFNAVAMSTANLWNKYLNAIQVSGGSRQALIKFYTAYYHTLIHPNVFSDVNGQYMGFDNQVHTANGSAQYANYSGWDIYRTEIPLLALFQPAIASDMVQSMLNDAQQCGALPKWSQNNFETGTMNGYAGPTMVSSAYAFGATHFETQRALSFMTQSAMTGGKASCNGLVLNLDLSQYLSNYTQDPSEGLEDASMEFAVSQFAHALKDTNVYMTTLENSALWRKSFNVSTGYVQKHNDDGSWADLKPGSPDGYTEGNPAQYTLMVPFDLGTLVQLMSQSGNVLSRLDDYFSKLNAGESNPNLYIGNEPDFGGPWVYNWAKKPSSAQKVVHSIIQREFTSDPGGLPGNDDLGAMSAWLVWADLGMYPEIPGVGGFALNTPAFPNMTLKLGNGRTVQITSSGAPSYYIQQMTLNRTGYNRTWLPLSLLSTGGTVKYTLGPQPSTWGTGPNTAPPSYHHP